MLIEASNGALTSNRLCTPDMHRVIFIFGVGRSGTTWLGKIFDSHPDVIYRHEPDGVCADNNIPMICQDEDIETYIPSARIYLDRLKRSRHPQTVGHPPMFRKSFETGLAHHLRYGLIRAYRLTRRLKLPSALCKQITIPDFAGHDLEKAAKIAIKSVFALGRMQLFQRAAPESRTILLIRHPCGYVASVMRGWAAGVLRNPMTEKFDRLDYLAQMKNARSRGLSVAALKTMTPIEVWTWRWVLMNEKALQDAKQGTTTRVVRYEDLCAQPVETTKELFAFTRLDWQPPTTAFLSASTSHRGEAKYYSVYQNTKDAAEKWRREMSAQDVETVMSIAASTEPGRLFCSLTAAILFSAW